MIVAAVVFGDDLGGGASRQLTEQIVPIQSNSICVVLFDTCIQSGKDKGIRVSLIILSLEGR
jgi:hypothetical protein